MLRSCSELQGTLDHTVVPDYRVQHSIKHARVLRADASTATVDLDATIDTVATDGRGTRTRTHVPNRVWAYLELSNELNRPVKVESIAIVIAVRSCQAGAGQGSRRRVPLRVR